MRCLFLHSSLKDFSIHYDYVQFLEDDYSLSDELVFDVPDFYEQCNITSYCNYYNNTKKLCTQAMG